MKLSQIGEFGLIELIKKLEHKRKDTVIGIGDDCAVLKTFNPKSEILNKSKHSKSKSQKYLLVTTDALVENVHFTQKDSLFNLGQKALIASISDIAAMGGVPTHAVVTVGFSKNFEVNDALELIKGINSVARKHKIDIVGGDTVASPKEMFVSVTMLGEVEKGDLLLRSGARVGDLICVTGKFGGPASLKYASRITHHALRIAEAHLIAKSRIATSMIDSSDGLVRSVLEICKASNVGAEIETEKVPRAKSASLDQALYGGEEYELVFTAPKDKAKKLKIEHCKLTIVGRIVSRSKGIYLLGPNGKKTKPKGGYEHFK